MFQVVLFLIALGCLFCFHMSKVSDRPEIFDYANVVGMIVFVPAYLILGAWSAIVFPLGFGLISLRALRAKRAGQRLEMASEIPTA